MRKERKAVIDLSWKKCTMHGDKSTFFKFKTFASIVLHIILIYIFNNWLPCKIFQKHFIIHARLFAALKYNKTRIIWGLKKLTFVKLKKCFTIYNFNPVHIKTIYPPPGRPSIKNFQWRGGGSYIGSAYIYIYIYLVE